MFQLTHYFSAHPKVFLLAVPLGYYLIGLIMLFTIMRDDQMEAAMRQRVSELPGSAPELLLAGLFVYGILPLLWPAGVMSIFSLDVSMKALYRLAAVSLIVMAISLGGLVIALIV